MKGNAHRLLSTIVAKSDSVIFMLICDFSVRTEDNVHPHTT